MHRAKKPELGRRTLTAPPWLLDELNNWRRWSWSGDLPHPLPPTHAASAEGQYIAESDLGEKPEPKSPEPDAARAKRMEAIYQGLPRTQKLIVRGLYVYRAPPAQVARRVGVGRRELERQHAEAIRLICDACVRMR